MQQEYRVRFHQDLARLVDGLEIIGHQAVNATGWRQDPIRAAVAS